MASPPPPYANITGITSYSSVTSPAIPTSPSVIFTVNQIA